MKDSADLPAPVEENIVEDPAPVKPGESVDIAIPTENASSVEVTDLPEGLTYDSEKSKIAGKPKASGKAKVDIITNDAKVITDTIDIQVEESGGSTTPATTAPATTTSEDSTPEPTTTTSGAAGADNETVHAGFLRAEHLEADFADPDLGPADDPARADDLRTAHHDQAHHSEAGPVGR